VKFLDGIEERTEENILLKLFLKNIIIDQNRLLLGWSVAGTGLVR
jgi:hypothetical protein